MSLIAVELIGFALVFAVIVGCGRIPKEEWEQLKAAERGNQ